MVVGGGIGGLTLVLYPIRNHADGTQMLNWVFEMEADTYRGRRAWNRLGDAEGVMYWVFDWLELPALLRASEVVLEFRMMDQDPLPRWSFGDVTLLGDAAHPMVPRGSNGAGQAILDARCLADQLARHAGHPRALRACEAERLPATTDVVPTNRAPRPTPFCARCSTAPRM